MYSLLCFAMESSCLFFLFFDLGFFFFFPDNRKKIKSGFASWWLMADIDLAGVYLKIYLKFSLKFILKQCF